MTRSVCRAFLAQVFLGNLAVDPVRFLKPPDPDFTGLNFDPMFWSDSNERPVAVEKIKCLIQYFQATQEVEPDKDKHDEIRFSRMSVPDVSSLDWDRRIDAGRVSIDLRAMEGPRQTQLSTLPMKTLGLTHRLQNASPRALDGGDNNPPILISTGKWGCGAFGGNVVHKFLQQVVAVSLCTDDRRLLYSAYGKQDEMELLERVLDAIHGVRCEDVLGVIEQEKLFGNKIIKTDNYLQLLKTLEKLPRLEH
ncbi:hypothetical protein MHU86_23609 [Fragilaria crotonensis]|nr:hypothetical protein MHU86_23609 [Fragilaria crotonensis]